MPDLYEFSCLPSSIDFRLTGKSDHSFMPAEFLLDIRGGLIYISIGEEIIDRVGRGMLFPLLPYVPGEAPLRAMLVGEKLWRVLESPEGDENWERRVGELRADLEVFVTQPDIEPKYLFLLFPAPEAVWEIRSTGSDPSIRVLGLFAEKDVFVATNFALRSCLGGWQSRAWKAVKGNAKAIWRVIFGPYNPVVTTNVHDLVTGAVSGKYFKSDRP